MIDKDYCISSYLTFRYVAEPGYFWKQGVQPDFPSISSEDQIAISQSSDISEVLKSYVDQNFTCDSAVLLSGGIDSAIIASYLPEGTKAYTIRFMADGAIDETAMAAQYARAYNLDHTIVDVYWSDFMEFTPYLMKMKNSPLHAVEVGVYKAASLARQDKIKKIFLGNGADSTFGGLDKLLSKEWNFNEFVQRYTFVSPKKVLKKPVSMLSVFNRYRFDNDYIDYISFLKDVHGTGIIQAFENAIKSAGCISLEPYESMKLAIPLDLAKIRNGNSKYMLRELFSKRYPDIAIPNKIAFARPMDTWLEDWSGPDREEFLKFDIQMLSGDQKWLIYCLELFLNQIDA